MDFYTIHELAEFFHASTRTIERRLKKLDKDFLDTFIQVGEKNKIMYSEHLIEALGGKIDPIKTIGRVPEGVDPKKMKPRKEPPKVKRDKGVKVETAVVISETTPPMDDRIKITNLIFQAYQMGNMLLRECSEAAGVKYEILQSWIVSDVRIFNAYSVAREKFKDAAFSNLQEITLVQMQRSISGYSVDLKTEHGLVKMAPNGEKIEIPQNYKTSKKYVVPRADLIMFALTNRAPDEWKRIFTPLNEPVKPPDPLDQLTEGEMLEYLEKAKQAGIGGEEKKI